MKKIAILILLSVVCLLSYSQEYDFFKHSYKFSKAGDQENDPRLDYYDVGFYFLNLTMDNASVDVAGSVIIDLNLLPEYSNELVFDLKSDMSVDSVKINGEIKSFTHSTDVIVVDYSHLSDYNADYDVSAQIFYHGTPSEGMFNESEWYGTGVYDFTYSLSEPYAAKYWFPCKQVLYDKADSSYCYITVPENLKAGSNGILVNEINVGGGKKRMEWQSSYPIDFYLISVAIGEYQDYSFYADIPNFTAQVLVQNFIPDNSVYLNTYIENINNTEDMLVMYSDYWGLFPHHMEKYGHCIVPLGGGMEHQTMTTLGNFDFILVTHELAHSWFGDYLTCANWQDIWINEGFASYGEYMSEDYLHPDGYELSWLGGCQALAKEATTGSVYVPFEELSSVDRVFNYRLTYRKGACLVHMIRYMIDNDELFFSALREFLSEYGNSTATAEDLKAVLETQTGIDFDPFFEEWYYGEGFPTYSVVWWQSGNEVSIEMNQTTSAITELFTIPMEFKIVYDDDTYFVTRQQVNANYCTYHIPVEGNVVNVIVNPSLAVLADISSIQSLGEEIYTDPAKIFPNPSDGRFNIMTEKSGSYYVEIFNAEGKKAGEFYFDGNTYPADLSGFAKGIYTLKLTGEGKTTFEKVVITE